MTQSEYISDAIDRFSLFKGQEFVRDFEKLTQEEQQRFYDKTVDLIAATQELHPFWFSDNRDLVAYIVAASLFQKERSQFHTDWREIFATRA